MRVQGDVALPSFARNRAQVTLSGQYIDAPEVDYYGIGNFSSNAELEPNTPTNPNEAGPCSILISVATCRIGGGVSYLDIETSAPITPALQLGDVTYITSTARAAFDWRQPLGYRAPGGSTDCSSTTTATATAARILVQIRRGRSPAADSADARELGRRSARARDGDRC